MTNAKPARNTEWALPTGSARRIFIWVMLPVCLLFFLGSLGRPFVTDDALIYSMIGEAIYQKGMLPFTYVFDHKPLVTYYLYGILAVAFPNDVPKYQVVSLLGYAATAWVTWSFARKERWTFHFLVLTGLSLQFLRFSANTELFFAPLALISVLLVLRSRMLAGVFLAGLLGAVSFNMNYLAVFSIGPPVLYALFFSGESRVLQLRKLAMYAIGFAVAVLLIFAPLLLKDPQLVADFFAAQRRFLRGYNSYTVRAPVLFFISAIPLVVLAAFSLPCDSADRRTRNVLALMTLTAFLGAISSGKFFAYYLYPVVVPLTALFALSSYARKMLVLFVTLGALVVASAYIYVRDFGTPAQARAAYDFTQYRKLKEIVGDEKLLSVRAHMEVTYFSGATPAQPYLWENHAHLILGPGEDDYFVGYLEARPKFVVTSTNVCAGAPAESELPQTCRMILDGYHRIMAIEDHVYYRRAYLYQRNGT